MGYKDKNKQRDYQREWKRNRREEFFKNKACLKCGRTTGLNLHHRVKSEKTDHKIWSWTLAKRQEEIEKCDVLCSSCHAKQHGLERRTSFCGTDTSYRRGCRCEKCRTEHSRISREYTKRKKLEGKQKRSNGVWL